MPIECQKHMMLQLMTAQSGEDHIREAFRVFDKDEDGFITVKEQTQWTTASFTKTRLDSLRLKGLPQNEMSISHPKSQRASC